MYNLGVSVERHKDLKDLAPVSSIKTKAFGDRKCYMLL